MLLKTKTSVRVPSFFGPFAVAAGLLTVACFSEPFWQNFYILEARALNTTLKAGAWGVCTKLRNTTGVNGPTSWCTSKTSGYALNVAINATGITQFPTIQDDTTLLGLNAENYVAILSSSDTGKLWLHVIAAIVTILTVASLATPPSYLGSERSALFKLQKSGMVPVLLGAVAFVLTFVTFAVDLAVIIPAKNKLNSIDGISASWGNLPWFALPSFLLMIPAFASVLMSASPPPTFTRV
ncbi:hypothetical protein T439DRAFT_375788 [Meredithblackwellia eburnea MCA 4105]